MKLIFVLPSTVFAVLLRILEVTTDLLASGERLTVFHRYTCVGSTFTAFSGLGVGVGSLHIIL